jgi:hypothetical protein
MATEHWFRWHHGTVIDPKWRVVASRCVTNVTVGHVVAVWAAMVENASQASPRGQLSGWDDEDVAVCLGFTIEQVSGIRQAMQGKVLDGDCLSSWKKRQPNREDTSSERTRAWRERKRNECDEWKHSVTYGDAEKRTVTLEESRGEKRREEKKNKSKDKAPASPSTLPDPPEWVPAEAWSGFVENRRKIRHPMTPRAAQLVIAELTKLRAAGQDPGAVLDQSTRNGWRDVFGLREQGNGRGVRGGSGSDIFAGAR